MRPTGYDVLLIDEHLGEDLGTDLVASLADQDPAFAGRCVLVTGSGPTGEVPAGATVLAKPFDTAGLRQLVDTVASGAAPARRSPASKSGPGSEPRLDDQRELGDQDGAWPSGQRQSAGLISTLREHDYRTVADLLHDGPAQELGASILALELIRRAVSPDLQKRLDEVVGWLAAAAGSMRDLATGPTGRLANPAGLAGAMPLQVRHVDGPGSALRLSEQIAVLTVAELVIEAIAPPGLTAEAAIKSDQSFILIEFRIFCDCADGGYLTALSAAAALFGGRAESGAAPGEWLARVVLPRLAQGFGEDFDHAFLLGRGDLGVQRQAQQFRRGALGDREAVARRVSASRGWRRPWCGGSASGSGCPRRCRPPAGRPAPGPGPVPGPRTGARCGCCRPACAAW